MGCAAGWGRIFMTGLTISIELLEWGRVFSGFGGMRIFWQVGILAIKNIGRFGLQI